MPLGLETGGELVALELDPVAKNARWAPVCRGGNQIFPFRQFVAGGLQKFTPVIGAEASPDHARPSRQTKVVIEEDALHARRIDPPHRRAVFRSCWRMQRGPRLGGPVRPYGEFPVCRWSQRYSARPGTEGVAGMTQGDIDQVSQHPSAFDLPPPLGELFKRIDPVAIEETG